MPGRSRRRRSTRPAAPAPRSRRRRIRPEPVAQPLDRRAARRGSRPRARSAPGRPAAVFQQARAAAARARPRVDEHEAARSRTSPSPRRGREAAVPEERRLLVAGDARDRQRRAEELRLADDARTSGRGEAAARGRRRRARAARRPRRATRDRATSSVTRSSGRWRGRAPSVSFQTSHESTVPNASSPGRAVGPREQPLELRRREVRVRHEPRPCADQVGRQLAAARGRPPVLPDDRAVDRPPGGALPEQRRLALVRDPDRAQVGRTHACVVHGRIRSLDDGRPDLLGVVLDPPGLREVLSKLAVAAAADAEVSSTTRQVVPVVP